MGGYCVRKGWMVTGLERSGMKLESVLTALHPLHKLSKAVMFKALRTGDRMQQCVYVFGMLRNRLLISLLISLLRAVHTTGFLRHSLWSTLISLSTSRESDGRLLIMRLKRQAS